MAAVSRFFHALPKGRGGGAAGGRSPPARPGRLAGRGCWGAAPPGGWRENEKTTGYREKGREKRKNPWLYNASTHDTIRTVCI